MKQAWQGLIGLLERHIRLVVHVGALLPLALLVFDALRGDLTVNPIQAATLRTGKAALVLLILSLACTPVAKWLGFRAALKVRRALGLYAFLYASIHFFIFAVLDYGLNLEYLAQALLEKRFALVGLAAGLLLLALAVTSFKVWQRRLGKNWKRLHRLAYLAGILAVVHYVWLVKADTREPLLWGAGLTVLLVARLVRRGESRKTSASEA